MFWRPPLATAGHRLSVAASAPGSSTAETTHVVIAVATRPAWTVVDDNVTQASIARPCEVIVGIDFCAGTLVRIAAILLVAALVVLVERISALIEIADIYCP